MKVCSFIGHREVYQYDINERIKTAITDILQTDEEFVFYSGGMGAFDEKCSLIVNECKHRYRHLRVKHILVLPYMTNKINAKGKYYESLFDSILIPEELLGCHYKAAIKRRNEWMVDRSNFLIAYVYREHGGAFATLKYAEKQNVPYINLAKQ